MGSAGGCPEAVTRPTDTCQSAARNDLFSHARMFSLVQSGGNEAQNTLKPSNLPLPPFPPNPPREV
eukprot:13954479-Alexandrium_andersonii.AAC.1